VSGLHVVVRGVVQGVGFRYFVRHSAQRLELAGWVRNLPDGGVEVAAGGESASVQDLRELLATGPPGAVVERIEDLGDAPPDLPKPFAVVR
jgi:acylphosphatase